ncbi:hypothetical protein BJ912DRAFT_570410 [Pholiota molesta]|nr:hypothetical protein BJ912DRAFT_570410 [Pholiota molesta]
MCHLVKFRNIDRKLGLFVCLLSLLISNCRSKGPFLPASKSPLNRPSLGGCRKCTVKCRTMRASHRKKDVPVPIPSFWVVSSALAD